MKRVDNPTSHYRASGWGYTQQLTYLMTGEPWFTWNHVPLMVRDGAVKFGLQVLSSPFASVSIATDERTGKPKISGPPDVREYIARTWKRFWTMSLPKLVNNYHKWGRAPGGNEWAHSGTTQKLELVRVRAVEPFDAEAHTYSDGPKKNHFAGFQLNGQSEQVFVPAGSSAFYFSGFSELAPYCDQPRIATAFASWLEKTAPMGVRAARRLHSWTQAVGITMVRHPDGMLTDPGTGIKYSTEQKALQIGAAIQNGSVVAMSSALIGTTDVRQWEIEQREPRSGGGDIAKVVMDLDGEIWFGMGIPNEVIRAMDSGSGRAGRSIPMEVWLAQGDSSALQLDQTFREHTLAYGIRQNFGKVAWDYELTSLLDEFKKAGKEPTQAPGGSPSPDSLPGGGGGAERPASLSSVDTGGDRFAKLTGMTDPDEKRARRVRAAAMLAMIDSRLREAEGGAEDDEADDERHALAELADDPEGIDAAMGVADLSWVAYGKSRGGSTRWKDDQTNKVRYQESKPGEHGEKRTKAKADAATAHGLVDKVTRNEATAADLKQLADHLPAMTVADLRTARGKLEARFGNARKREEMVAALTAHVHGRKDAIEGHEKRYAATAKREDGTPAKPVEEDVHTVPTSSLVRRPDLMQYKVSGIGKGGVTDELKSVHTYNPKLGGTLLAWRNPETGEDIVVNGHHRHELAERAGHGTVNVRYIKAPNVKEARAEGALANIAEGRGTAIDAAKYLKDSGQDLAHLTEAGISLSGKVAADAVALKDLSPTAFKMVVEGKIPESSGIIVAKAIKDLARQEMMFKKLQQRSNDGAPEWNANQLAVASKMMAEAGTATKTESNLFGDFEEEHPTFDQEVELREHVGRALRKVVLDYASGSNAGRAERIKGAGNVINVDENKRLKSEAEQAAALYDQLNNRSGPISAAIKKNAVALMEAQNRAKGANDVKDRAVEDVRNAIAETLSGPLKLGGGGGGEEPVVSTPGSGVAGGAGGAADNPNAVPASAGIAGLPKFDDLEDDLPQRKPVGSTEVPGVGNVTFIPHPSEGGGTADRTVMVPTSVLEKGWSAGNPDHYIPPGGGGGEIGGRRANVETFLTKGKPVEASAVHVDEDGKVQFRDGRHRFSVLRDKGAAQVAVTVDKTSANRLAKLAATTEAPQIPARDPNQIYATGDPADQPPPTPAPQATGPAGRVRLRGGSTLTIAPLPKRPTADADAPPPPVANPWGKVPKEAADYFEKYVASPLRDHVADLDGVHSRNGARYAWESAIDGGKTVDSPPPGADALAKFSEVAKSEGMDPAALVAAHPEYADLLKKLRAHRSWGTEKWERGGANLSAVHAPAGGAEVAGKHFVGGQFIPGDVLDKASPAERAAVGAGGDPGDGGKPAEPKPTFFGKARRFKDKVLDTKIGRLAVVAEHKMFLAAKKTQAVAIQAAKERGLSQTETDRLHRTLATADFIGGYGGALAVGSVAGPLAGKVAAYLPTASAAYLMYSTARNPKATWAAALKVAKESSVNPMDLGREIRDAWKGTGGAHLSDAAPTTAQRLAALLRVDDPELSEWRAALFTAAVASGKDEAAALAIAEGERGRAVPELTDTDDPAALGMGGDDAA